MDRNRRLAEALGICWHEWEWKEIRRYYERSFPDGEEIEKIVNGFVCRICREVESAKKPNPDFTADPRLVLEVINPCDAEDFINYVLDHSEFEGLPTPMDYCLLLCDLFKDQTGKLCDLAREWMEGRGK